MSTLKGGRKAANVEEAAKAITIKGARKRAQEIKKAAKDSWNIENRGINGLCTWALREDNLHAYTLPFFAEQVKQGRAELKSANVNKGLIKYFALPHEKYTMQEGVNYEHVINEKGAPELKRLFSINFLFTLLERKATFRTNSEEWAKFAAKRKAAYLEARQTAADKAAADAAKAAFVVELIRSNEEATKAAEAAAQLLNSGITAEAKKQAAHA